MDKELKIKAEDKINEEALANKPWLKHRKKMLALLLFLLGMGSVYYFLTKRIEKQSSGVENFTLEKYADEKIEIDPKSTELDLFQSVDKREHLYKIPAKHYQLQPSKNIRYARLAVILLARKEKDLDNLEKNEALILEILNTTLRRSRPEDFEGAVGKEGIRTRLLNALNEQIHPPLIGLRFDTLVLR